MVALKGAATDNLGGETRSGEEKEYQETERRHSFGLDERGKEMTAHIAIGRCRDFGSSTVGYSAGGRAGEIEIGAGARVAIATGAPMKKKVKKQEIRGKNKKTCHGPCKGTSRVTLSKL